MSGARDVAMMQAFRHEYGILCAILTGLMESTQHTRLILDPSSLVPTWVEGLLSVGRSLQRSAASYGHM